MNPYTFPIALLTFISFALVIPVMYWFLDAYAPGLPAETQFLAYLVPISLVGLFIVGWLEPGGG